MHRQSIGLSTGTRHLHIGTDEDDDKSRRRSKSLSVNVSIADIVGTEGEGRGDEEDDEKSSKPDRPFRYNTTEKSIHFIPLLTLLCFFVLYMFSHNPSPNDLAGIEGLPIGIESDGMGMGRLSEASIRSNRRLKELGGRKLGGGSRRRRL
ncbi:hypothetical protein ZOSMA_29G01480 [Zostera marina]|uniref:Transmembrane protein n=1 Tax=Zostera marina TaxID=29655 RepID=A0A0K9PE33_ZOSMR|nr:hypothetical protein ZOSMA_29G01480 [Zostera marina]